VEPHHLRVDLVVGGSRATAVHDESCPDIGPICAVRDEPPQQHHTTLWLAELRLIAEYGLTPHVALQAALPLRIISTSTRYTDLAGKPIQLDYENIHHRDETLVGLGDMQLLLHTGASVVGFALGLRVGVSLPTGEVHENPFRLGAEGKPHEHIQFGTGTFDPVLGLDAGRALGAWTVSAFGQAQVPLYQGAKGYRAGARLLGGVAVSHPLGPVSLRLAVTAAHEEPERWDGAVPTDDGNQGRTDLLVGPGITVPFAGDWNLTFDVGVRAYGHTVGAQLDMPVVLSVSVGRLFHLEKGKHVEPLVPGATEGDVADAVLHGEAAPLTPVSGKWTVFDFWATWCEACGDLDGRLRELARTDEGLAVRRVNVVDDDSPIWKRELRGVESLPHVRLIRPDGTLAWEASGKPAELVAGIHARMAAGEQVVEIRVTPAGFEPAEIRVAKGKPVKLIITRTTDDTCATDLVIDGDGLDLERVLPLGKPVEVRFTPAGPGPLSFHCAMNMVTGTIVVE
jgi:hypothetical protein